MRTIINSMSNGLFASVAFAAVAERQRILPDTSKDKPKAEKSESMEDFAARCDKDIEIAAKDSHSSEKSLIKALCSTMVFAAKHGQPGKLTALWKAVSLKDREAIRVFVFNVVQTHGTKIEGKPFSFMTYNKEDGFKMKTGLEKGTDRHDAAKTMRESIEKAGEHGLSIIRLGKNTIERDMEEAFDPEKATARFLKSLAKKGEVALAKQINRALDANMQLTDGDIEEAAKDGDITAKIAKKTAELARLQKQAENRPVKHVA